MKKIILLVLIGLLPVWSGCNDPEKDSGSQYDNYRGLWTFNLTPSAEELPSYIIAVETEGGSGAAVVSIIGPFVTDYSVVNAGIPVALGDCGVTITFGNTTDFFLAGGDSWKVTVNGNTPSPPIQTGTVFSVTGPITSNGVYDCETDYCLGSALSSAIPFPTKGIGQSERDGGQWLSVRMRQDGPNVAATIPEQHALTLYLGTLIGGEAEFTLALPVIQAGDTVTISYRRQAAADGEGGDFFKVFITNGTKYLTPEIREGAAVSDSDTVISYTFQARSSEIQVDFAAGLSAPGEFVLVDDVRVTSGGNLVFADDFESTVTGCSPAWPDGDRWELRSPFWSAGSFCVTASGALTGSYSARWSGGSYRRFSGSIITGDSFDSTLAFIPGLGGANIGALTGLLASAYEPDYTYYLTEFSLAKQGAGSLIGTFRGEDRNHNCTEVGNVASASQASGIRNMTNSVWLVNIQGEAENCQPPLPNNANLAFGDTLSTASGETVGFIQLGGFFVAIETTVDEYANNYDLSGILTGDLVTLTFQHQDGMAQATGMGAFATDQIIAGALTGTLVFDGGRVCTLAEGSVFTMRKYVEEEPEPEPEPEPPFPPAPPPPPPFP